METLEIGVFNIWSYMWKMKQKKVDFKCFVDFEKFYKSGISKFLLAKSTVPPGSWVYSGFWKTPYSSESKFLQSKNIVSKDFSTLSLKESKFLKLNFYNPRILDVEYVSAFRISESFQILDSPKCYCNCVSEVFCALIIFKILQILESPNFSYIMCPKFLVHSDFSESFQNPVNPKFY